MRTIIAASLLIAGLPAVSVGQSDLQKIGKFLQGVQQLQQQQNNRQPTPSNPPNQGYRMSPGNPNSSGDRNRGNFIGDSFFGPSNGQWQTVPQNGSRPPYSNQPPYNTYPPGTFPNNGQVIRNHQGHVIYPNGSWQPQVIRDSGVASSGSTVYADPPKVPVKSYSRLPIVLRCAPDAVGTCQYELLTTSGKAFPYTINAGQAQNLVETTDWAFRYRPQPNADYQTYRLRGGKTYEIHKLGDSWQFYMVP